ncbi:cell wall-binding repeat-containing protein [Peptoclostridium sp. AF21-18]|uniref:cell wall-binding repeat-containing protein n=1 Tax=Peptoclostridium sp. AF21-18 TaxID=2292243 RepID=UPI000E4FF228|nr:cell wall-binding repeat-containing protein [Peptoclostridium sp. AF21-18]
MGGNSVVDKSIAYKYNVEVLAGKDRYATNKEVINEFYSVSDKLYIANGDKLVDALTASPLAKKDGIVLVNEKSDKSILKGKDTVQVGGMDFEIEFEK